MKIGFHTDAFNSSYFSFEACLQWAQRNNVHYIECGLIDGVSWIHGLGYQPHVALYEDPLLLRRKMENYGVCFSQVDAAYPLSGKDGPLRGVPYVMKAIQCIELTSQGAAVHPRAGDLTYPEFAMQRCTQCKRCTVECPFGAINEDAEFNPLPQPTRCRRCGVCMGACPERIISFKNYSVAMIGSMIKAIHVPEEDEEKPRILVLACENDAYPALDMAGTNRMTYNAWVRVIPMRCLGSMNLVWIADSLSRGIDGIILLACQHGDDYQCHFIKGSELANIRLSKVSETLERLALESDRVRYENVAIIDYPKLPAMLDEFAERLEEVGPNPFKGW